MRRRVTVGVVGLGPSGAGLAARLMQLPEVDLRWLCDRSKRARVVAAAHPGARVTAHLDDVLGDDELDAVVLATPPPRQHRYAARALDADKHVLLHGGLGLTGDEADALIGRAERQGRRFLIGHPAFFDPAVRKLREVIELGRLGELYYLYGHRRTTSTGSNGDHPLWHLAAAELSIAVFLLGERPIQVAVRGESYIRPGRADVLYCYLQFTNGTSSHLHLAAVGTLDVSRTTAFGSVGTAVLDDRDTNRKLTIFEARGDIVCPSISSQDPVLLECDYFVSSIRSAAPALVGGREGALVLKSLDALRSSLSDGGMPVVLRRAEPLPSTVIPMHRRQG
jgi:predicted dehydrogenase